MALSMAANILNSPRAVAMSVYVIRAFINMREQLAANAIILKRLAEIDKKHCSFMTERFAKSSRNCDHCLSPHASRNPNQKSVSM